MPKDKLWSLDWYDYPHKYNIVGDMDRPNGVYYLSDIEKYINDKYGIADTLYIILLLIISYRRSLLGESLVISYWRWFCGFN
jgi:hypothetical protein